MEIFERFEAVARAFLNATEEEQNAVLNIMTVEEREAFLKAIGAYRLLTDDAFYRTVRETLSEEIYNQYHK